MNRKNIQRKGLALLMATVAYAGMAVGQDKLLAFPGAEGYGAYATGGRGGEVYHVTNLNASGAGSLADAVSRPNRIVVFDVGGIIDITNTNLTISSNITIEGQTAPGGGITLYGGRVIMSNAQNVIIRYLRMRGSINMDRSKCTLTMDYCKNVILDHCSISWGRWDNVHIKDASDITWQYCIIGEGIDPQRFGAITDGTRNWSVSNCLWINNKSRNPKMKCGILYYNNVVYNYAMGIIGGHSAGDNYQDVINNYFITGPNSGTTNKYFDDWTATDHLYSSGNYTDGNRDGKLNGTLITDYNSATPMKTRNFTCPGPTKIESAATAYSKVVEEAGASRVRDQHDQRMISHLTSLGKEGAFIDQESDVGGIGTLTAGLPPKDSDGDGMSDEWELANGLDIYKNDALEDSNGNGYTNIEDYANSLAMKAEEEIPISNLNLNGLISAIAEARSYMNQSTVGEVTLGYPASAREALEQVLTTAEEFYANIQETTTQGQVTIQVTKLNLAISSFKKKIIYTLAGYDPTHAHIIYSYGTHPGARDENATTSIQRRYLTTVKTNDGTNDSLVYRIGLSDKDISAGKSDALWKETSAQWTISPAENGNVYIRNVATGTYLQIANLLSPVPATVFPYYAKEDNGKHAFYMEISNENTTCLNVGVPDSNNQGGPLELFKTPADRTRLRWVIEDLQIMPTAINAVSTDANQKSTTIFYDLRGMQLQERPDKGIYIEKTVDDKQVKVRKIRSL